MRTAAIGFFLVICLLVVINDQADAQPYGGCKEAIDYPRSDGADWCRRHGWTVTRHIVVRPDHWVVVYRDLPECTEFGVRPCHMQGWRYWLNINSVPHEILGRV